MEIKCSAAGDELYHPKPVQFARLVLDELQACDMAVLTTILSFDLRVLQAIRKLQPTQRLCLLLENVTVKPAALFGQLGFIPEVFGPDFRLLSSSLVQKIKSNYPTLQLVPWTANGVPYLRKVLA